MKHFRKIGCSKIKSWSTDLLRFTPKNLTISHQWRIHQKQKERGGGQGRGERRIERQKRKGKRERKKRRGSFTESFGRLVTDEHEWMNLYIHINRQQWRRLEVSPETQDSQPREWVVVADVGL